MTLIVTNISEEQTWLNQITYDHTKDLQMSGISAIKRRKLKPGEQFKQEIKATINNIDSRCVVAII